MFLFLSRLGEGSGGGGRGKARGYDFRRSGSSDMRGNRARGRFPPPFLSRTQLLALNKSSRSIAISSNEPLALVAVNNLKRRLQPGGRQDATAMGFRAKRHLESEINVPARSQVRLGSDKIRVFFFFSLLCLRGTLRNHKTLCLLSHFSYLLKIITTQSVSTH